MNPYGPNAPGKLATFCEGAIYLLDNVVPEDKLRLFLTLRYDTLNRAYPHDTFSAGEATLSFFPDTLAYVSGARPIPANKEEDYPFRANWLDWCRLHAKLHWQK